MCDSRRFEQVVGKLRQPSAIGSRSWARSRARNMSTIARKAAWQTCPIGRDLPSPSRRDGFLNASCNHLRDVATGTEWRADEFACTVMANASKKLLQTDAKARPGGGGGVGGGGRVTSVGSRSTLEEPHAFAHEKDWRSPRPDLQVAQHAPSLQAHSFPGISIRSERVF